MMQNRIGLRQITLTPESALATKLHQPPENSISKVVHPALGDNKTLADTTGKARKLVSENTVLVLGRPACCLCHVMKRLLFGLGVNPAIYDLAEDEERQVIGELRSMFGEDVKGDGLPLLFIGAKLFGGLDSLMAAHISGKLVPVLKQAGALWL